MGGAQDLPRLTVGDDPVRLEPVPRAASGETELLEAAHHGFARGGEPVGQKDYMAASQVRMPGRQLFK